MDDASVDLRLHGLLLLEACLGGATRGDDMAHGMAVEVITRVSGRLLAMLQREDLAQSRVARLVRKLTESKDIDVVQVLVRAGLVPLLFTTLAQFRRHDDVLAHVYHFLGPSFNFALVQVRKNHSDTTHPTPSLWT